MVGTQDAAYQRGSFQKLQSPMQMHFLHHTTQPSRMVSVCALGYNYGAFFEENLLHKNISQEVQKTDHEFHSISFALPTFTCSGFMLA